MADRTVKELLVPQVGEIYNQRRFRESIDILNASGHYAPIDPDRAVECRTDDEAAEVSIVIKLNKRN